MNEDWTNRLDPFLKFLHFHAVCGEAAWVPCRPVWRGWGTGKADTASWWPPSPWSSGPWQSLVGTHRVSGTRSPAGWLMRLWNYSYSSIFSVNQFIVWSIICQKIMQNVHGDVFLLLSDQQSKSKDSSNFQSYDVEKQQMFGFSCWMTWIINWCWTNYVSDRWLID